VPGGIVDSAAAIATGGDARAVRAVMVVQTRRERQSLLPGRQRHLRELAVRSHAGMSSSRRCNGGCLHAASQQALSHTRGYKAPPSFG
jgi:hypothetical protein